MALFCFFVTLVILILLTEIVIQKRNDIFTALDVGLCIALGH